MGRPVVVRFAPGSGDGGGATAHMRFIEKLITGAWRPVAVRSHLAAAAAPHCDDNVLLGFGHLGFWICY
jgi:hypothetical protein